MAERQLLASREPPRFTVRRVIVGERRRVLHVRVEILETCIAETGPCGPSGPETQSSYFRPVEDGPQVATYPAKSPQVDGRLTVDDTWLTEPEDPMPWSEQV
jgi:hypothetical protein